METMVRVAKTDFNGERSKNGKWRRAVENNEVEQVTKGESMRKVVGSGRLRFAIGHKGIFCTVTASISNLRNHSSGLYSNKLNSLNSSSFAGCSCADKRLRSIADVRVFHRFSMISTYNIHRTFSTH